jgi:hypothetical protein
MTIAIISSTIEIVIQIAFSTVHSIVQFSVQMIALKAI